MTVSWGQNDKVVQPAATWGQNDKVIQPKASWSTPFPKGPDDPWYMRALKDTINVPMSAPGQVMSAVKGPTPDPRFQDVPNMFGQFEGQGIDPRTLGAAKMFATTDDQYADVIEKQLGVRFLGRQKDANGADVFEFIGPDGKAQKGYINKPGLDLEDVDRFAGQVMQALPAGRVGVAAAGARAGAVKMGLAQATAMGTNSLAKDVISSQMGSQQGLDFRRAMWEALGAFGGEGASRSLGGVVNIFKTRKLFKGGQLTDEGKQLAEAYGIDPADLSQQYQKQFAKDFVTAEDPMAAARKVGMESRGIHPTTGMITRNNEDLLLEEDIMKRGILDTPSVKRSELLSKQYDQIRGEDYQKARHTLIEQNVGVAPPDKIVEGKVQLGKTLDDSVTSKYQQMKQAEQNAWDDVKPIVPDKMDLGILRQRIKDLEVDNPKLFNRIRHLDPQTQSNALAVRDQMDKLVKGRLKSKTSSLYGKAEQIDLDTFRRRLGDFRRKAFSAEGGGSDYKAVTDQIDIFNDYLDDMATKANVEDAVKLMKARDLSAELRQMFSTRGDPAMDPGGRFLRDLIEKQDTSPEAIVDKIFSSKDGLAAYRRLKESFDPNASELKMMKAYAFEKNFYDNGGKLLSPEKAALNVEKMRQSSLYQEMFSPSDQMMLDRFINQTRSLDVPKAVRGKGSAWAQATARIRRDGLLRYFLQRRGQSATFQSKPLESFAWQATARTRLAAPVSFLKDMQGDRMFRRIKEGTIPKKKSYVLPSGMGATGATVGSKYGEK